MLKTESFARSYGYKHIKKLEKQVEQFYYDAKFIPAPRVIDLLDIECILRVAEDLTVFGKRQCELRDKIIELL
jgi:hypothetical protein